MGLFNRLKKEVDKKRKAVSSGAPVAVSETKSSAKAKKAGLAGEQKVSMKDLYEGGGSRGTTTAVTKEKQVRKFANAYRILIKPVITERAAHLGTANKYVFAVAEQANKIEIAQAINEVYGIKPIKVNVIKMRGKQVKYGKIFGQKKNWQKAIVTLPADKTINIYEGV